MKRVLIVDDSIVIHSAIKKTLAPMVHAELVFAKTYAEVEDLLFDDTKPFHVALLDLHLPDAPHGEVVGLIHDHDIPAIVLTGLFDDELKEIVLQKDVIDFINKSDKDSIAFAAKTVNRILKNYETTALIVDDSRVYRTALSKVLRRMNIQVLTASDGKEALNILQMDEANNISLVITDYQMPNMDGMQLTMKIRSFKKKDDIAVLVVSTLDDTEVITRFLKVGANDYIIKPFTYEEVAVRINTNLELIDLFQETKDQANKDFLTGAYNRRFFFDSGNAIFAKNRRKKENVCVGMLDIDKFKRINDTYGHDVGDIAIKSIKTVLDETIRASDLVARFGGEEFCILLEHISLEDSQMLFEKVRKAFEEHTFELNNETIQFTVSIGVCYGMHENLEKMIKIADDALYDAKNGGRNRVVFKDKETVLEDLL